MLHVSEHNSGLSDIIRFSLAGDQTHITSEIKKLAKGIVGTTKDRCS